MESTTMKKLALLAALSLSINSYAHDNNNECSYKLLAGVTVSPNTVEVFDNEQTFYKISSVGDITINGHIIDLSDTQRQQAQVYANLLRQAVPQNIELANEAIALASSASSVVLAEVFGDDSVIGGAVDEAIKAAEYRISQHFIVEGDEYTISPNSIKAIEEAFDREFSQQLEQSIEQSIENGDFFDSLGNVFSFVGSALLFGDGDFEQRIEAAMEKKAEKMAAKIEGSAMQLEGLASQVCSNMTKLDGLESQLKESIKVLPKIDLIDQEQI